MACRAGASVEGMSDSDASADSQIDFIDFGLEDFGPNYDEKAILGKITSTLKSTVSTDSQAFDPIHFEQLLSNTIDGLVDMRYSVCSLYTYLLSTSICTATTSTALPRYERRYTTPHYSANAVNHSLIIFTDITSVMTR